MAGGLKPRSGAARLVWRNARLLVSIRERKRAAKRRMDIDPMLAERAISMDYSVRRFNRSIPAS